MPTNAIELRVIEPVPQLAAFVENFWMVSNDSATGKEIVILPDGRFDIIFSRSAEEPFHATLRGLDTKPEQTAIPPKTILFAISFRLLAIEYLLKIEVASVINEGLHLAPGFWNVKADDLYNFDNFCKKVTAKMLNLIQPAIDNRKQQLFELIYDSYGSLSVKELSERVFWSSRQINRYFNQQFGISLKAYCNILRFRSSLQQIKEGKLFPEQNFSDQAHFIKEIKKFSGVVPKELFKNQDGRFILLSALPKE